jgi:hypothetical protein
MAIAGDAGGEGSGESAEGSPHQAIVKSAQHDNGVVGVLSRCADRTHKHRDKHGGRETLARNVADHNEQSAITGWQNLKEIAPNLLRRLVDGLHGKAGERLAPLRQNELLDLAGSGHLAFQLCHLRVDPDMSPPFADKNKNKTRIAQKDAGNGSQAIECEPIVQARSLSGSHLHGLRRVRKPISQQAHENKLQREQREKRLPELTAQGDAGEGIGDSEQARQHNSHRKPQRRLAAHVDDVIGKPESCENKEYGKQKNNN